MLMRTLLLGSMVSLELRAARGRGWSGRDAVGMLATLLRDSWLMRRNALLGSALQGRTRLRSVVRVYIHGIAMAARHMGSGGHRE